MPAGICGPAAYFRYELTSVSVTWIDRGWALRLGNCAFFVIVASFDWKRVASCCVSRDWLRDHGRREEKRPADEGRGPHERFGDA